MKKDTPPTLFIHVKPFTSNPKPLKDATIHDQMCAVIQVQDILRICCEFGIDEQ
jgi:hypothetical protein